MEAAKQRALEECTAELGREIPEAALLLDKLRRAGLGLQRTEPDGARSPSGKRTWLLYVEPPVALRERFDLAPELLLVLSPWSRTQARNVNAAERALARDHRLDRGVVLHVSPDHNARRQLSQAVVNTGRLYIMLTFDEVLAAGDPERWFGRVLGEDIAQSDLFASGRPVTGWDFVGREQELRSLRGRLLDGRPVGLFGLRKIGKTSMLLGLRDQLLHDATGDEAVVHAVPIHVDMLAVSFGETNVDGILRLVLESTLEAIAALRIEPGSIGLRGAQEADPLEGRALRERVALVFKGLIGWARDQPARPIVLLLIDEYERLLGAGRMPVDDGLDFLDFIRGLVQQHTGAFNFLVAGLDRRCAAQPRYDGRQNPLFGFLVDVYLAGLDRSDMNRLMRRIGRRLALELDSSALDVMWSETGGHPYLAREFGRVIDAAVPVADRQPGRKLVDATLALGLREQFRRTVDNTMQEICAALGDLDGHAPAVLARASEVGLAEMAPQTVDLLRRLGILAPAGEQQVFRIAAFGAWIEHSYVGLPLVADG